MVCVVMKRRRTGVRDFEAEGRRRRMYITWPVSAQTQAAGNNSIEQAHRIVTFFGPIQQALPNSSNNPTTSQCSTHPPKPLDWHSPPSQLPRPPCCPDKVSPGKSPTSPSRAVTAVQPSTNSTSTSRPPPKNAAPRTRCHQRSAQARTHQHHSL